MNPSPILALFPILVAGLPPRLSNFLLPRYYVALLKINKKKPASKHLHTSSLADKPQISVGTTTTTSATLSEHAPTRVRTISPPDTLASISTTTLKMTSGIACSIPMGSMTLAISTSRILMWGPRMGILLSEGEFGLQVGVGWGGGLI